MQSCLQNLKNYSANPMRWFSGIANSKTSFPPFCVLSNELSKIDTSLQYGFN